MTNQTDQPSQTDQRIRELASGLVNATERLHADPIGTSAPFPELADPPGDYELSVWVRFGYHPSGRDDAGRLRPAFGESYVLACAREQGRWRLKTSPHLGHDDEAEIDVLGEPIVELRDQERGLQPLTMLRALLAGRLV